MKCTQFVFTLILAFIVGCSGGGHSGAKKDAGQDGGCDPDCHVDCFGGVFCEAGELWVNEFGATQISVIWRAPKYLGFGIWWAEPKYK